jgi:hypothetical protein
MQPLQLCVLGTSAVSSTCLEKICELRSSFYYKIARKTSHPSSKIHQREACVCSQSLSGDNRRSTQLHFARNKSDMPCRIAPPRLSFCYIFIQTFYLHRHGGLHRIKFSVSNQRRPQRCKLGGAVMTFGKGTEVGH